MQESRVKKSLLNARINLICYFISLAVAFFTRKILLDRLGTEFIGFTGTLQSLLGFLNMAELGVSSAIGYVLYKHIFDDDHSKINEIISVFGYLYRCIGLFIIGAGVILSLFLPMIFPNTDFSWRVIYLGYYSYLVSSLLTYFANYKMTLLSADQRNYEVMGYYQTVVSMKMLMQMALAYFVCSFSLFLVTELVFGILYSIVLNMRIRKVYPWLQADVKIGKRLFKKYPEIGKYTKQLFVHKIGSFVQSQVTPFLIYSYVTLPMVAVYGNYTLIIQKLQGLLGSVLDSTNAGVGNLISQGNQNIIYRTYKELLSFRAFCAGYFSIITYTFINPLISIWLGKQYMLDDYIVFLIIAQLYLSIQRGVNDQFLFGYGLFYDTWAPIVESIIFVLVAILGGTLWGLCGVLMGPIISIISIVYIWKPIFLFRRGFKKGVWRYWGLLIVNITITYIIWITTKHIFSLFDSSHYLNNSWPDFLLGAFLFSTTCFLLYFILQITCFSEFRMLILKLIKRK